MKKAPQDVKGWEQQTLLPPEIVEIVIKIGIVNGIDHYQAQIEWRDPAPDTLLGMRSWPSMTRDQFSHHWPAIIAELQSVVRRCSTPF
jgi:hypothetical protein